jgi:ribosome-binding factor A
MSRIDQINEVLRIELATLINKEALLDDGLITVCYVDCSPDLRWAKIAVSVLPENLAGTALKRLKSKSSFFSNILRKKLKMKFIPKFDWIFDPTEKEAEKIERFLREIKED